MVIYYTWTLIQVPSRQSCPTNSRDWRYETDLIDKSVDIDSKMKAFVTALLFFNYKNYSIASSFDREKWRVPSFIFGKYLIFLEPTEKLQKKKQAMQLDRIYITYINTQ